MTAAHHPEPPSPGDFKPTPWIAAVLSFLTPGLGHSYAGRPKLAIAMYLGALCFGFGLIALTLAPLPAVVRELLLIGAVVVPLTVVPVSAFRTARHARPGRKTLGQRWYVLFVAFVIAAFGIQGALVSFIKQHVAEAFKIPSGSMNPTMLVGDYIMVVPETRASVPRFTIVTYVADDRQFTHRNVGNPGDTLEMRDFKLIVNGVSASEPYVHVDVGGPNMTAPEFDWQRKYLPPNVDPTSYRPRYGTWGPIVVPANQHFVLGDDRSNSFDSRYRGFIHAGDIVGRPVYVYFSLANGKVRWRRFGKSIR